MRFSGSDEIPGSPYRPAGFCFFEPHPEAIAPGPQAVAAVAATSPSRDFRSFLGQLIGVHSQARDRRKG